MAREANSTQASTQAGEAAVTTKQWALHWSTGLLLLVLNHCKHVH